jgi:Ca2+-binding EF-hand superfamily protein
MDGDQDGRINYDEFAKYYSTNVKAIFDALDSDKGGVISANEWNKFLEVHSYGADGKSYKKG